MEVERVIRELKGSQDPHIRICCLKVLGGEGRGERERQAIFSCLQEGPDPIVRHEAAFWLGGDGGPGGGPGAGQGSGRRPEPAGQA